MKDTRIDRLYELLPVIYRMRDAEQGGPLKALLQIISEQVNLVEDDIQQLYENWFIETCDDWVVPYLGDLIGYEPVHEAGEPSPGITSQGQLRNKVLIPRREVANTIRYRRSKGTLALLELLANDVAGWPARAVEFNQLLARTQSVNHLNLSRGKTIDIRNGACLELMESPFDKAAHTIDVRRINSHHTQGRHNIPSVGVFVWRLKSYSVTKTPAYCQESAGPHCFTFSVLGNDSPLYMLPEPETDPTHIADEINLPVPIRRKFFEDNKELLYGPDKSLYILKGAKKTAVPVEQIQVADLTDWQYIPKKGMVAVDPELGRIAFPSRTYPKTGVWVKYHYGFSTELGGGEYTRSILQPSEATTYRVGEDGDFKKIKDALKQWWIDKPEHAVIEIVDSGIYVEQINIDSHLDDNEGETETDFQPLKSLQIRAGNHQRPIIRLLDWQTSRPDSFTVDGDYVTCFTLDGILLTGRGMQVSGNIAELTIRHSTLVPGWTLDNECEPERTEPSLEIFSPDVCVKIEHSIIGSIQIAPSIPESEEKIHIKDIDDSSSDEEVVLARCQGIGSEARLDPLRICISDSILDATDSELEVLGAPGCPVGHACLTILRSTVIGQVQVRSIELAENSIFDGRITVARRQKGCIRFSYVTPESRTPSRYRCQPDLAVAVIMDDYQNGTISGIEKDRKLKQERARLNPIFNSKRYGTPNYCQLSDCCAEEIKSGADDESEMGVFHNLYQPQRMANLKVRLDEYLPARMDIGIIVSS